MVWILLIAYPTSQDSRGAVDIERQFGIYATTFTFLDFTYYLIVCLTRAESHYPKQRVSKHQKVSKLGK